MSAYYNKYYLILAAGLLSFSLKTLASPQFDVADQAQPESKVVEVVTMTNGKWGLQFKADPNRATETNDASLSQKQDLYDLATYGNTPEQFPLDLAEVVSYYYASETHHFTLAMRYPDSESELEQIIYDFCIYDLDPAAQSKIFCKSMHVRASKSEFMKLLKQFGVDYKVVSGSVSKKKLSRHDEALESTSIAPILFTEGDDNTTPPTEEELLQEYIDQLMEELRELCEPELCLGYGYAFTNNNPTGTSEVHGWYYDYVDGTSDMYYKPRPVSSGDTTNQPIGDYSVIE